MMGWTRSPESGPASQMRDVLDFVRPRLRRYGVQSGERKHHDDCKRLLSMYLLFARECAGRLTRHFDDPCKATPRH